MVATPVGPTALFAYLYLAVVSVPITVLALSIVPFAGSVRAAILFVVGGIGAVTGLGAVVATATFGLPVVGPNALAVAVGVIVLCWLPLWIGRAVCRRITDRRPDDALGDALPGWPLGMVSGLIILAAPDVFGIGVPPDLVVPLVLALVMVAPVAIGVIVGLVRGSEDDIGHRS